MISDEKRVLKLAIEKYQASRDLLGKKHPKTCKREDSGLKCWMAFRPDLPIATERFDQKLLLDFAEWRKREAQKKGQPLSGRAIDVNVTALANVLNWCVVQKWLPEFPAVWHWEALAEEPDQCELLTEAQVDQLCTAAMAVNDMALLDARRSCPSLQEYLHKLQGARQRFADYLRLLALSGARETETLNQRWANVRWNQRKFHFPGGRTGGAKRGGGSRRAAQLRDVDFFSNVVKRPLRNWTGLGTSSTARLLGKLASFDSGQKTFDLLGQDEFSALAG